MLRAGLDETAEADALRDSLDAPWHLLTEEERERINGLSADLYSLSDPPALFRPQNPQAKSKWDSARAAAGQRRFDEALALARRWQDYVEPAILAMLRGLIWHGSGHPEVASLFFEHASTLKPSEWQYKWAEMTAFSELGDPRALKIARDALSEIQSIHPQLALSAAVILLQNCRKSPTDQRQGKVRDIVRKLVRLYRSLRAREDRDPALELVWNTIDFVLGNACIDLGHWRFGEEFCKRAVEKNPTNVPLVAQLAMVQYRRAPDDAIEAFQGLREFDEDWDLPHLFIALHQFENRRFQDCVKECERGFAAFISPRGRALLLELRAISRMNLGGSLDEARVDLNKAVHLDPSSDRIRRNRKVVSRLAKTQNGDAVVEGITGWEPPSVAGLVNQGLRQTESLVESEILRLPAA
jgi:tetratricopeptide (TPR) repeat protein